MSGLVDANGRPLSASSEPDIVSPGGVPVRSARGPAPASAADRTIALPHELPARLKWRALLAEAMAGGWDPTVDEPVESILCADIPLRQLLEVLTERDVLVGLVRGRDGFGTETCVKCGRFPERCTCDGGDCWVCGCTDAAACEGGCSWVDAERRVCSSCVDAIALEDLELLRSALERAKPRKTRRRR